MSDMTEEEFWAILHSAPEPKPVFYRLYHNDNGSPIIYSMEDLPGNYIEVDPTTYTLAPFNVEVVDGKLQYIKPTVFVKKLKPNQPDGAASHPQDVCVIVDLDQPHVKWNIVNHELN
jgi:hypothetical protein